MADAEVPPMATGRGAHGIGGKHLRAPRQCSIRDSLSGLHQEVVPAHRPRPWNNRVRLGLPPAWG
jgi:hypothetical protein